MISEHFRQNIQPLRWMPGQPSQHSWELNGDGSGKSKSPGVFGCVPLGLGSYMPLVCSKMSRLGNWVQKKPKHWSFEWNIKRNWLVLKATRFQKRFWKRLVIVIFARETIKPNLTRLVMLFHFRCTSCLPLVFYFCDFSLTFTNWTLGLLLPEDICTQACYGLCSSLFLGIIFLPFSLQPLFVRSFPECLLGNCNNGSWALPV